VDFFANFGNLEVLESRVKVILTAEKIKNFVDVVLHHSGEVTVECDRCLENLVVPAEGDSRLTVRFGKTPQTAAVTDGDDDADVVYVNDDDREVDLTDYVYQCVLLSLPMQRVHGDDENGTSLCNPEMLKYISNSGM
jgi:uncharacterized metal-binding protein YceD (DUF177 family)